MTAWSSECWILQMLQSGGFEVEKEGTAVIKLSVDKEGSNCGAVLMSNMGRCSGGHKCV